MNAALNISRYSCTLSEPSLLENGLMILEKILKIITENLFFHYNLYDLENTVMVLGNMTF